MGNSRLGKAPRRRPITKKPDPRMSWLPVDMTFFPDMISFGKMNPVARFFLAVEMVLAALVVLGTFGLTVMELVP
jgi:hypothetical protein